MNRRTRSTVGLVALAFLAMPGAVGCQTDLTELLQALQNFELNFTTNFNQLQTVDPRDPNFVGPGGRPPMITDGVDLITDPSDQLEPGNLGESLLIGFQNTSPNEMYIEYNVDDEPQAIYAFTGETILLEYHCATTVEVTLEEDYTPGDYMLVNTMDWTGTVFTNTEDFDCASALIITMDGFTVNAEQEVIDPGFGMFPPGPPLPPDPNMGGPDDGMNMF